MRFLVAWNFIVSPSNFYTFLFSAAASERTENKPASCEREKRNFWWTHSRKNSWTSCLTSGEKLYHLEYSLIYIFSHMVTNRVSFSSLFLPFLPFYLNIEARKIRKRRKKLKYKKKLKYNKKKSHSNMLNLHHEIFNISYTMGDSMRKPKCNEVNTKKNKKNLSLLI